VIAPVKTIKAKSHLVDSVLSADKTICSECGGNGYMKTTPNCYHTCLHCLGRGLTYLMDG